MKESALGHFDETGTRVDKKHAADGSF